MNKYIIVLVLFVLSNTKSYEYTNQTQADIEFEKQKEKCKNADLFSSIETHLTTVTHTVTEGNTELLSELGLPSSAIEQIVKAIKDSVKDFSFQVEETFPSANSITFGMGEVTVKENGEAKVLYVEAATTGNLNKRMEPKTFKKNVKELHFGENAKY